MPVTLLTDIAEANITAAIGTGDHVEITHIALGDANGVAYDPTHDQTSLVNELARRPIDSRILADPETWRVETSFPPETAAFDVYEIGFFDADGDLIAVWAGADVQPRRTGVVTYQIEHVLNFSRVAAGVVIVDAPDDALFNHAVINLETQAIAADEQVKQRLLIRDLLAAQ